MKIETIIFDFDGTLANSTRHFLEIAQKLAPEFKINLENVDENLIKKLKKKSYRQIMQHFGINILQVPKITKRVHEEFMKTLDDVVLFEEIAEVIKILKDKGVPIGILTSNSKENVQKILKNNQLAVFDFVYESKVFGQKSKVLEKIIRKYGFEKENTIYVGDETRDIEAAQKAGILSAAVGWGFNDIEVLNNLNPDVVLLNPKDLLNYIN